MQIRFAKKFVKQHDKAGKKIQSAFDKKLKIFIHNQFHPQLNNHALSGKFSSHRSINITGDWRALYSVHQDTNGNVVIIFEMLGTHSQLYK